MISPKEVFKIESIEHNGTTYPVIDTEIVNGVAVFTIKEGKIRQPLIGFNFFFGDFAEYGETEMVRNENQTS